MTTIQHRRGVSADWVSYNPILSAGELGVEIDTGKYKLGDGVSFWNDLDYFISELSIDDKIKDLTGTDVPDLTTQFENGLY